MNLKCETIDQLFRKIIQQNSVIILESTNKYYRKIITKSGRKMDLYPAMARRTHDLLIAGSSLTGASNILVQDMNPVSALQCLPSRVRQCVAPEVNLRERTLHSPLQCK